MKKKVNENGWNYCKNVTKSSLKVSQLIVFNLFLCHNCVGFFKWHNSWPFQLVIENKNETKWLYFLLLIWTFFLLISPSDIVSINELTWILKIICQYNVNHVVTLPIKTITAAVFLVGSVLLNLLDFCFVLLCVFTFWVLCCDVHYDFRTKTMFDSSLSPVVMSYLRYLCLFV